MPASFLDYGFDGRGQRQIYGTRTGIEASDTWYLYQYLDEIRQCRRIANSDPPQPHRLPRKEKYFLLHALLQSTAAPRLAELGSSLFEIIDGLEAAHIALSPDRPNRVRRCAFLGIEASEFLSDVSRLLHPGHNLTLFASVEEMQTTSKRWGGIVYDRIVSSLAFHDTVSLARFMDWFDVGILNLLTSRGDTFRSEFFGANYTYFSLADLDQLLTQPLFHLFGFKAPSHSALRAQNRPVVEGFFFYGSPGRLQAFVEQCLSMEAIRQFWTEKQINPRPIATLV